VLQVLYEKGSIQRDKILRKGNFQKFCIRNPTCFFHRNGDAVAVVVIAAGVPLVV